mgnify:CR=1 FL=1
MRTIDMTPLFRSSIGFDRVSRLIEAALADDAGTSYPPYNIEKTGEHAYRITMAVAGFSPENIDITALDDALVVTGKCKAPAEGARFLHRGIASRQFQRAFVLAEGIEVEGAWLDNGLLHVDLRRPQPETRVRTIRINGAGRPVVSDQD